MTLAPTPVRNTITPVTATVRQHGECVVVDVRGEVDMLTAPQLCETLLTVLERGPRVLVIDLLAVSFLGVSGLATLIQIQQWAGARTRLRLVPGPATLRPLYLTGLDRRFTLYPTRDDALGDTDVAAIEEWT